MGGTGRLAAEDDNIRQNDEEDHDGDDGRDKSRGSRRGRLSLYPGPRHGGAAEDGEEELDPDVRLGGEAVAAAAADGNELGGVPDQGEARLATHQHRDSGPGRGGRGLTTLQRAVAVPGSRRAGGTSSRTWSSTATTTTAAATEPERATILAVHHQSRSGPRP